MIESNRHKEYVSNRVLTASPMELIRILYEAAIQAVDEALTALHGGDILSRGRAVTKAVGILAELQASLRHDVQEQYSNTLGELYVYIQRQLMRAHAEQSESLLLEASRLLNTLLEGWTGAIHNLGSGSPAEKHAEAEEDAAVFSAPNPYSMEPAGSKLESRSWQL